jgi:hypothetical protein
LVRIFEELLCGCLVSEDGGGALIPCCYPEVGQEESELHKRCMDLYYNQHKSVEEIKKIIEEKSNSEKINEKELNLIQKIQLKIRGFTCIGLEKRKGWSAFRKIYLVRCPEHGLYSGVRHGLNNYLPQCPKCMKEEVEKSKRSYNH